MYEVYKPRSPVVDGSLGGGGYRFTDIPTDMPIDKLTDRHVQKQYTPPLSKGSLTFTVASSGRAGGVGEWNCTFISLLNIPREDRGGGGLSRECVLRIPGVS